MSQEKNSVDSYVYSGKIASWDTRSIRGYIKNSFYGFLTAAVLASSVGMPELSHASRRIIETTTAKYDTTNTTRKTTQIKLHQKWSLHPRFGLLNKLEATVHDPKGKDNIKFERGYIDEKFGLFGLSGDRYAGIELSTKRDTSYVPKPVHVTPSKRRPSRPRALSAPKKPAVEEIKEKKLIAPPYTTQPDTTKKISLEDIYKKLERIQEELAKEAYQPQIRPTEEKPSKPSIPYTPLNVPEVPEDTSRVEEKPLPYKPPQLQELQEKHEETHPDSLEGIITPLPPLPLTPQPISKVSEKKGHKILYCALLVGIAAGIAYAIKSQEKEEPSDVLKRRGGTGVK
ncbi:hypothetical protein HYX18_04515 [Candidatus Woesearchaeota archaeon]|nr:hypothetical protein [Candidatus Woesearchaeota archaeon]